jgi:tRNA-modifying protein YgfZ
MHEDLLRRSRALPQLSAIRVSGSDARTFLQGQLSANVEELAPDTVLLASCNSAQGRVQGVLWLLQRDQEIVLITASELADATVSRLKKYVLRAKVKFEPPTLGVRGVIEEVTGPSTWHAPLRQLWTADTNVVAWPSARTLIVSPLIDATADADFIREWQLRDVHAGVPQIHMSTHESFVAQMLNLDVLGGISFEKGCYTGQEIIARTHFRGSVKRRMFRFAAQSEAPIPGSRILAGTEPAGEVVTSVATGTGCELLAVIQLAHLGHELTLDTASKSALAQLPLPYAVGTGEQ